MLSPIFKELPYVPILLEPRHAEAISHLIDTVRAGLGDHEKHYLKPRSATQALEHLDAGHLAIGVFSHDGQLIGCTLMKHLTDPFDKANNQNFPSDFIQYGSWALQSVAVHPMHNRQGIMPSMLRKAQAVANDAPARFQTLIAKVALTNEKSHAGFLRAGFNQVATGIDHTEGYPVVYLAHSTSLGLATNLTNTLDSGYDEHATRALTPFGQ